MKQDDSYSDEILNAFIDGELSSDDELSILNAMQKDDKLLNRINDLKRIKKLVSTLYQDERLDSLMHTTTGYERKQYLTLVASVLLVFGIVSGWFGHSLITSDTNNIKTSKHLNVKNDTWKIVLHVNTNDEYVQKTILDETENLLDSFKGTGKKVKVEIVAYGKGVFLFDKKKSKYPERIKSLKKNFTNLSYAVCGRTLKRIEEQQHRKINLITDMVVSRSGIYQIIKRQKQGWNYIRI